MIYYLQFTSKDDVLKFNKIATSYSFDIWVHNEDQMFDAKTLLALYTLPMNKDLKIVVEEGADTKSLFKDLDKLQKKKSTSKNILDNFL
ncbi:hypothetical protein [Halalkalibacterium halodurans]|uniref:hypothetical protein n=1 Tax=Halalkalibacterium halodurans TaxID=86665 RepID=UPI002AA9F96D|nr:hypothetical protein [Halalkalibacterium halodurans]MDY7222674.1 hypothetical protein [Halalkalibacterium halodurans]MDY7241895.1 hypothetical protein [Halalkalibacterium halodurans]